ncbi:MAG: hypothetical protein CVV49_04955 [Spirochaetae bacterium HGW-Spirochaetae-5]|nr:MAG: hypothetical protein CVV49_04955 [Spirochaetae bacterium HGW-Spirochaetae-5]
MNDFFMILFKAVVFLVSFAIISRVVLRFMQRRNPSAKLWDIEIIAVSAVFSVIVTSMVKHIFKIFI